MDAATVVVAAVHVVIVADYDDVEFGVKDDDDVDEDDGTYCVVVVAADDDEDDDDNDNVVDVDMIVICGLFDLLMMK